MLITSQHVIVEDEDRLELTAALSSREFHGASDVTRRYECLIREVFESPYALSCGSGTAAIYLALSAAGVGPGTEVVLPPTAAVMSGLPILALGARPVFCDVRDPRSFSFDAGAVAAALTPRTKVVLSVPMWGYAEDLKAVREVCDDHGVLLVEDAAVAHGCRTEAGVVGTQGHIGCFSTHARKLVATGEGGFCVTADGGLYERMARMRTFGLAVGEDPSALGTHAGLNFKLPGLAAAVGIAQLRRLSRRLEERERIAAAWKERLRAIPSVSPFPEPVVHNRYGLALAVPRDRRSGIDAVLLAAGVLTDTTAYRYRLLCDLPIYRAYRSRCSHARELVGHTVVLPCHEAVGVAVMDRACSELQRVCSQDNARAEN